MDERDRAGGSDLAVCCCGVVARIEDAGVSMLISSLMPEELPLGNNGGGGVRMRSSNEFQKFTPPEYLTA